MRRCQSGFLNIKLYDHVEIDLWFIFSFNYTPWDYCLCGCALFDWKIFLFMCFRYVNWLFVEVFAVSFYFRTFNFGILSYFFFPFRFSTVYVSVTSKALKTSYRKKM